MGANIGNHVNLATLDVHEMCCLTIEDGVTVQNDAMLSGHTFATARNTIGGYKGIADAKPVLIIGRCWIKKDSVVGPYAMVQPPLPRPFNDIDNELSNNSATVVEGILPAMQATSRLGQTLRLSNPMMTRPMKDGKYVWPDNEPTVWTPAIPGYMQFLGFLVMILFHWIASLPLVGLVYAYLVPAAAGPGILVWFLRLWVLHSPYLTVSCERVVCCCGIYFAMILLLVY